MHLTQLELTGIQAIVAPPLFQQLVVIALFLDLALLDDHDAVGVTHGGQTVGNDENGAALHEGIHTLGDQRLGTGIDGGGSLVQNHDGRSGDGGAGGAATGFIPDTADELRAALEAEHPEIEYTEAQISAMLADEAALTDWTGAPNAGSAGTATTFGVEGGSMYSTADPEAYVPLGGVYEPFSGEFFALSGHTGIRGGKGGARKVQSGGTFTWVTDGEDVVGEDGTAYHGGRTGRPYTSVSGLPEANLIAYGGNGAGAAVGLDRDTHPRMDGGSDQSATWEVTT